jgi:hypothetical protein
VAAHPADTRAPATTTWSNTVTIDRKGQIGKDVGFFIRLGNGTKTLDTV